jgi:hypothetical protein
MTQFAFQAAHVQWSRAITQVSFRADTWAASPSPCATWCPHRNATERVPRRPEAGVTFGKQRYTEVQNNRVFVTVECLYGFKAALADGTKRIVKP